LEDGSRVVARDDNRRCYTNPMITMVKKPLHPEIAALTLAMTNGQRRLCHQMAEIGREYTF
jgi:hypothetical protein